MKYRMQALTSVFQDILCLRHCAVLAFSVAAIYMQAILLKITRFGWGVEGGEGGGRDTNVKIYMYFIIPFGFLPRGKCVIVSKESQQ